LIVNGEGSMHHNSKNFNKKMSVLRKATESNVPCYLLNSLWQDNSHIYDDVLSKLKICTREVLSHEQLKSKHGVDTSISIDASYFAEINLKDRFINLNGKPIKTDFYFPKKGNWEKDNNILFPDGNNIEMSDFTWSGLVRSLETASLLITGRHHAVYAACKARIPFIVSDSNSHKITGLFKTAGVTIPIAKSPEDLKDLRNNYKSLEPEYLKLFNWLDNQNIDDVFPF
jgi:exopolysaccharide biosynthesis predicted pyruvyltransferase EpsI